MKAVAICERCSAPMQGEQIVVSSGEKLKNISAWTCTAYERVEYGTTGTSYGANS
jgi:hypothetical protein